MTDTATTRDHHKASFWTCDDEAERLTCDDQGSAIEEYLDALDQDEFDAMLKPGKTITVYGYDHMPVDRPRGLLAGLLEDIDEEYGDPEGDPTQPTERMVAAEQRFIDVLLAEYQSWACHQVTSEEVEVLPWVKENSPHLLEDTDNG